MAARPMQIYPPWYLERAQVETDMGGLKKDQNPCVLSFTANEFLGRNYHHHLKIFTDGSKMEDKAA